MKYKNNNHDDYRFEYKNDHILVLKYYTQTKKYAPYTSMLSERNMSEETFNKICEDWYTRKIAEERLELLINVQASSFAKLHT